MALAFENFDFSYKNAQGKPVFVPNARTRRLGDEIRRLVGERVEFAPYYFHFRDGAHIAALHAHRANRFFARIDLKNFFYSVGRNRVRAALKSIGINQADAERYAKWSTVKNPYQEPPYALPYGFPQSPLLASLVLRQSALGAAIEQLHAGIVRSVYLDDIAISGGDLDELRHAFQIVCAAAIEANFTVNQDKVREPAPTIDLFNCDLIEGHTTVREERVALFYDTERSPAGVAAFESYRERIVIGNN